MSEWKKTFITYDNMCYVDRLKAAKADLPFEKPFNKMWQQTNKIIDTFHLKITKEKNVM